MSWASFLAECLERLADRCVEAGPCVIGHIKGVALFDRDRYLRLSVVDASRAADVDGDVPEGCREFILTLNVLVYGHSRDVIQRLTGEVVASLTSRLGDQVAVKIESLDHRHED